MTNAKAEDIKKETVETEEETVVDETAQETESTEAIQKKVRKMNNGTVNGPEYGKQTI